MSVFVCVFVFALVQVCAPMEARHSICCLDCSPLYSLRQCLFWNLELTASLARLVELSLGTLSLIPSSPSALGLQTLTCNLTFTWMLDIWIQVFSLVLQVLSPLNHSLPPYIYLSHWTPLRWPAHEYAGPHFMFGVDFRTWSQFPHAIFYVSYGDSSVAKGTVGWISMTSESCIPHLCL